MQTKSNKIGNVSWTVHCETGNDVINARKIWAKVYDPVLGMNDPEYDKWLGFIEVYVQSEDVHVPFEWPAFTTDVDKLRAARDAWLKLPGRVYRTWKEDISEVDKVSGDEDLLPPQDLSSEKKMIPESSLSEVSSEAS